MTDHVAVRVDGLGKCYRLGQTIDLSRSLRESIMSLPRRLAGRRTGHQREAASGTIWAIRDVSFDVRTGEAVGVIGRNGAGKSTLLKILSRITNPTEGRAEIRGRVASLLEVGTGFHPELTGRENVYLNGAILGMRTAEIDRKFDEIVAFAEVEKFLDTPVKRYSSGMRVRLAFAVAAHLDPEVLVIDEVLAVGDAEFQQKCLGTMQNVTGAGRTVLFVSHNMEAIKTLCDRGVLLENGRLRAIGTADEVVEEYLARVPKQRVGEPIPPHLHAVSPPDLEVFRLDLVDGRGQSTSTISMDEPIGFEIHYRIHNPDKRYLVVLQLYRSDGLRFGTLISSDGVDYVRGDRGATGRLVVRTNNVFQPGTYSVTVRVKSSLNTWDDTIEGIRFIVNPVSATGAGRSRQGMVRLVGVWSGPSPSGRE